MLRFVIVALTQCVFLAAGQMFLKLAMVRMEAFSWTWRYFGALLTNWWLLATGASFGIATVLWMHILRNYPFSLAYPFSALAYLFGMLAALFVFGETVPLTRWIGVVLIVAGAFLMIKQ